MTMREKMARAMEAACEKYGPDKLDSIDMYPICADAALDALMEPTEGMKESSAPEMKGVDNCILMADIHGVPLRYIDGEAPLPRWWKAMIRAAKEGK